VASLAVLDDEVAVATAAAARVTAIVAQVSQASANAVICLTGGRTPERLYRLLATPERTIDWPRVHVFWGDERHVPPDHPDSNYGMAARALLTGVPIPPDQIHRMRGELPDASEAALDYDEELRAGFARASRQDRTFDLMLLGLGEDAHIASIFPGSPLLVENPQPARRVAAVWAPHLSAWRITLSPAAIMDARRIVMLVSGAKKADAVHAALELPTDSARWPVHVLRSAGDRLEWFLDRAAAARLSS
jgi:6-phosphogluconolactonase